MVQECSTEAAFVQGQGGSRADRGPLRPLRSAGPLLPHFAPHVSCWSQHWEPSCLPGSCPLSCPLSPAPSTGSFYQPTNLLQSLIRTLKKKKKKKQSLALMCPTSPAHLSFPPSRAPSNRLLVPASPDAPPALSPDPVLVLDLVSSPAVLSTWEPAPRPPSRTAPARPFLPPLASCSSLTHAPSLAVNSLCFTL